MASILSTLPTSTPHGYSYDVFLSFRGEDTRNNFTDHLYNTLIAHGIHTFRDDEELQKGDDIKSGLSTAIQSSKIFLIILSENYATSKWCLNELVKIVECTTTADDDDDDDDKRVIPVFYHVHPRDVGHQSGSFQDAFLNHQKGANEEKKEMIQKWRIALEKVAKLSGYHVDNQHEAELIKKIREVIITRLKRKPLYVGDNIVGMDFHLKQLKSLMKVERNDVYMIGIYGISGIGKTTMAMAIYNDISSQFDGTSFLRVGEASNSGLLELQKKLLEDTLKGQSPGIQDRSQGINVIKERLCSKRVLIVLDDVDEIEQLSNLCGKDGWYGPESIVIITTKDINLLNQHGVDQFYEVNELEHEEAIELFNWWAFKQNTPKSEDFQNLSDCVVKYARGLPLALKVLGGFLCDKSLDEWESELDKLKRIPNMKVQNILRASYDKLDDVNQEIFLDIACFFKGEDIDFVSRILGSYARSGIRVLQQRCLITISENNLDMHDLLQQMGREIVRKECPKEAGERSRLWDPIDVENVLTRNSGTKTIEGLFVEISSSCEIQFSKDSFAKMNRLRLLKVYHKPWDNFKVDIPNEFELSSSVLRYLHFWKYPLESLPTNFRANNLVELTLQFSNIKRLWKENEVLKNLKVINLSCSVDLVEMPDFASVPNLEILILLGCKSLENLPRNFHKLKHLRTLNCSGCPKLMSFPQIEGIMSNLRHIDFSSSGIVEVPSSIELLKGLEFFELTECLNLVSLPECIWNLRSLKSLFVALCPNLKGFPDLKDDMENLKMLHLGGTTSIKELPSSIRHLKALQSLYLSETAIEELPSSIGHLKALQTLDLSRTAIKELPSSIGHLKALQSLDLSYCNNLVQLPESICDLRSLHTLIVEECFKLEKSEVYLHDYGPPACCILKPGVIWSDNCFSSFKTLSLHEAPINPKHHMLSLSSLVELSLTNSIDGEIGISREYGNSQDISSLKVVTVGNFNPMARGILSDIFHQSSLRRLCLHNCNLMEEGILPPNNIQNLSSLVSLSLEYCNLWEGDILNHICHFSSLEELSLEGNHFSSIPASINGLSNLRALNLSHCRKLQDIPAELPSSLQFLDAHCSNGISSSSSLLSLHSLLNRFESELIQETYAEVGSSEFKGMGKTIVIPRSSTILEMMMRNGASMGSDHEVIRIKLPQNWYENNNDLLGFALCYVYTPMLLDEAEDEEALDLLKCSLFVSRNNQSGELIDELSFCFLCDFWDDCCLSDQMWVIYYPKDAIHEELRSNEWTHFTASFYCHQRLKVKECGIHLIHSEDKHIYAHILESSRKF